MNERIKQLALQAGFEIEEANFSYGNYKVDNEYFFSREDFIEDELKKFAELIVEECCVIVNQEALLTDHVPAEMNAYAGKRLKNAYTKIEEHFGVEE